MSLVLALWRTTDSALGLLVALQAFLVFLVYLDFQVAPEDFSFMTGCGAILAIMVLPWLFGATVLLILYNWRL